MSIAARNPAGALTHTAASLIAALALGLLAHLLGSPFGHDGSLRNVVVLLVDLGVIALLAQRGELEPRRLLRNRRRCAAIAALAIVVAAGLIAAEGAPNGLWELLASSAIIALTALVAAIAMVLGAEKGARAAVRALAAIVQWLRRCDARAGALRVPRRRLDRTLPILERFEARSRRGPPPQA